MILLLPRLPAPACERLVKEFLERGPERWAGFDPTNLPETVRFAATGGSRAEGQHLADLRSGLEELARRRGFGQPVDRHALAAFDADAGSWLAQSDLFSTGEALRDDVWSFVTAVVAPDIVHWRFGPAIERYTGGVRNTFQRLWMRGRALDRGPGHPARWALLTELTEDALVQITERPSIGGDPVLSLAVAEAWLRAARINGRARMEDIMRKAVLNVRIRNEIRSLSDLPADALSAVLDEIFGIAAVASAQEAGATKEFVEPAGSSSVSLAEAVERVRVESERRGLLSPKSRAALDALNSGHRLLGRKERNALDHLLTRLADADMLSAEVESIRSAMAGPSLPSPDPERPRSRSWAIWRAR